MAYTTQKFTDGQTLTAEHLNNIEEGISKIESEVKSGDPLLRTAIASQNEQLNTLVDLLVNILKGCVYSSNQTENLNALRDTMFGSDDTSSGVIKVGSRLKIYDGVQAMKSGYSLVIA